MHGEVYSYTAHRAESREALPQSESPRRELAIHLAGWAQRVVCVRQMTALTMGGVGVCRDLQRARLISLRSSALLVALLALAWPLAAGGRGGSKKLCVFGPVALPAASDPLSLADECASSCVLWSTAVMPAI